MSSKWYLLSEITVYTRVFLSCCWSVESLAIVDYSIKVYQLSK